MAKYLKLFQTIADRQAAELDYPNVNYTIENGSIEILESAPVPPVAFGGLTVKYNIEDPTVEVTLFNGGGGGSSTSSSSSGSGSGSGGGGVMPTRMIVDDNEETPINTWRFGTAGEHVVQYEFEDNIVPAAFMASSEIPATEAIIGDDIFEIANSSANADGAFQNSTITSVTIGTGITTIGESAFQYSHLETLTIKALDPPTLGLNALTDSSITAIYVPASVVEEYKDSTSTGWYEYASIIQAIQ